MTEILKYLTYRKKYKKTDWGVCATKPQSFLELWFIDNIIIPYNLGETNDIINEYKTQIFSIDFCFLNKHVCVELDGRCHLIHTLRKVKYTIERDNKLNKTNWKVYHITYLDIEQHPEETIKKFIEFISLDDIQNQRRFDSIEAFSKIIEMSKKI